jgi:hypothetical protein
VSGPQGVSTLDGLTETRQPLAVWLRRTSLLLLAALVALSIVGLLGVRTAERTAVGDGYRLSVTYPRLARAGLDTEWRVRVSNPAGLGDRVVVGVSGDWFSLFETQAFHPEPIETTRDGSTMFLTFATAPDDRTLVVDYDAYVQPAGQSGAPARVEVLESGTTVVSVDYRTWLLP